MSDIKNKNKPVQSTYTDEELLEDSDDDIEVVSKNDFNKVTIKKIWNSKVMSNDSDSEIVLDDSDSDIEEVGHVPTPNLKSKTTLDENKVKYILNKVASNQTSGTSTKFPIGLNISVSNNKTNSSKSEQSTPRIVLQKVGSKWKNSSTPKNSKPKYIENTKSEKKNKTIESDQSNSDDDFVPVGSKNIKNIKTRNAEDSDSDEDSFETIPKLNRSTRSTRSSVNTSKSDLSQDVTLDTSVELDDEIQEELAKLEALQEILAKHNPDEKSSRSSTIPKVRKSKSFKKKQSLPKTPKVSLPEIPKPKPSVVPQIIDRGPIDCFDELIVETTSGFPCNFCESKEMFNKRRDMIYHMQTKHEEELNKEQKNGDLSGLFPCEICKTAVYSKFILRTHRKAHVKSSEAGCDKYYQYYLRFGQV